MRNSARGILIENGRILLVHRIKNIDGVTKEYYVIPGGGIEEGEDIETTTKRELMEEVGIEVELIDKEPIFTLKQENGTQYFLIVNKISGEIGTGKGPEFSDLSKGTYLIEMINIKDIIDGKINLVPEIIKDKLINIIKKLNIDIDSINSRDLSE